MRIAECGIRNANIKNHPIQLNPTNISHSASSYAVCSATEDRQRPPPIDIFGGQA